MLFHTSMDTPPSEAAKDDARSWDVMIGAIGGAALGKKYGAATTKPYDEVINNRPYINVKADHINFTRPGTGERVASGL